MSWANSRALLLFGSRGRLLESTPSKNEVSGQLCLPVWPDMRLFADIGDFASALRETQINDVVAGLTTQERSGQRREQA